MDERPPHRWVRIPLAVWLIGSLFVLPLSAQAGSVRSLAQVGDILPEGSLKILLALAVLTLIIRSCVLANRFR